MIDADPTIVLIVVCAVAVGSIVFVILRAAKKKRGAG